MSSQVKSSQVKSSQVKSSQVNKSVDFKFALSSLLCSSLLLFSPNSHADLNDGLVAHWSFDDCKATDNSGNGHDGTLNGNPQCVDGVKGKAFSFDGIHDYINAGNSTLFNVDKHSIATWIKSNTAGIIIGKVNPFVHETINLVLNSKLQTSFATNYEVNHSLESVKTIADDKWHFVAMIYDGDSVKFYIDGILDSSYPRTGTVRTNNNELAIGRHGGDSNQMTSDGFFNGLIDETRIYNRALSESEIQQLYKGEEAKPVGNVDLSLALTAPTSVKTTEKATYQLTATNNGNAPATGVKAHFVVPRKSIATVDIPKNCTLNGRIIECALSDLGANQSATQTFSMTALRKGALSVVGLVNSSADDANYDDNKKSAVVSVK